MPYDVGAITAATQNEFGLFARQGVTQQPANRATPENLALLLSALVDFTNALKKWRADMDANIDWRESVLIGIPGKEGIELIDRDLDAWERRLDSYIFDVSAAPRGDRNAVLWSVTAPLLLGIYGGQAATTGRQPADVGTPFRLANMMLVSDEWRDEAFRLWQEDFKKTYVDLLKIIPNAVGDTVKVGVDAAVTIAGLAFAGWLIFGGKR